MRIPVQGRAALSVIVSLSLSVPLAACGGDEDTTLTLQTASLPADEAEDAAASSSRTPARTTAPADDATTTAPSSGTADEGANGADGTPFDAGADAGAAVTGDAPERTRDSDERVAAVQAWAEGYARAATEKDPDYGPWLETMTDQAAGQRLSYLDDDLGRRYPGPLPFTVTKTVDREGGAIVEACVLSEGFAIAAEGELADQVVRPTEFHLRREGGDLLVDGVYGGGVDCRTVLVEGKPW